MEFYQMTLVVTNNLDIMITHLHTKIGLSTSKVLTQRGIWTDITESITFPHMLLNAVFSTLELITVTFNQKVCVLCLKYHEKQG